MKDKFLELFSNIKRQGADKLLDWILKSDFFTAPASTKYHGSYEGGLCEHSINVYKQLTKLADGKGYSQETLLIVALLHDLCKVDFYTTDFRNVKNSQGMWERVPYYTVDDKLPYGHGEKSVYIISGFLKLTREEAMAIRWHMGGFDASASTGTMSTAFEMFPLAVLLHVADMLATYLDEKRG